ncbi:MAG: hypothetical protein JXQ66_03295 [Campylobacterales bacterium]|nr:hypothetical protein [Campylobacterales bacterium]
MSETSDANASEIEIPLKKALYINYETIPQRVIKGEIFSVTLKTLSTTRDFTDIKYNFSSSYGLELLNEIPYRTFQDRYFFDTFYFYTTSNNAKLPNIKAELIADTKYKETLVDGIKLNVIALNPKQDFSNIIANSLELLDYRTTSFDDKHNIIVFEVNATNTKLEEMKFKNVYKQGIESVNGSYFESKITYYTVIDKTLEEFSFSYFNLLKNRFDNISIPIIVDNDSVSTQTDLTPKDQSKERVKVTIASSVAIIGFILILWRKKFIYLIITIIPLGYIAYVYVPQKDICIKQGSNIYLLPLENGTVFEKTTSQIILKKEGDVKKFVKIKLQNNQIGWVKNEDICKN